jgi:hypothetical protein
MAFTATNNLTVDPNITLRSQQHAANLFNVDQFRLAPKHNFLFHVAFNINVSALKNANIVQRYGQEINMLVKGTDIPTYKMDTEYLNQYNRKKIMQYQHKPVEITIKFHDDNMSLINELWQNYYSYYYADSTSANTNGAYSRNAMRNSNFIVAPYGLDNGSTTPFFNYIKIYQMARHEYVSYQLMNPIITSFGHSKLDYGDYNKTAEWEMKIMYEAVAYGLGTVTAGDPEGFGLTHYDTTPSPLSGVNPDPTVNTPSFVQSLDSTGLSAGILNNAIATVSTYQNTQSTGGGGLTNTLGAVALGAGAIGAIGAAFPGAIGAIGSAVSGAVGAVTDAVSSGIDAISANIPSISDIF